MRLLILSLLLFVSIFAMAQSSYLFIGTYTSGASKGVYVYRFDPKTGKAEWLSTTEGIVNPSYLEIAPNRKCIYSVAETGKENPGSVSAFSFDRLSGKLSFLNKQLSGGDNPCYVTVHENNKWVVVANYSGGSLSAFPINPDGSLKPFRQLVQHEGKSINPARQERAHVHATVFSPDYKYLFTPDLGMDKIFSYSFNSSVQKPLKPAPKPFTLSEGGSGPRHLTFHPNNKFGYLIEEMAGTVIAYKYDKGRLIFIQKIAAHPANYIGELGSADIHTSPDGKFLYVSNRGNENTITIFAIDRFTGKLSLKGYQPTLGKKPRNFTIDPSGKYLLVANQDSDNIVIFKIDQTSGLLLETGEQISIPNPVCLKMMK